MKIDLYAKKIGLPGAQFLNTVEVPNDLGLVYKVPVRQTPSAFINASAGDIPAPSMECREFHYMHNPLQKLLNQNRAYVEI